MIQKRIYSLKREIAFNFYKLRGYIPIHFLHISKTGGTALKSVLKEHCLTQKYYILFHGHQKKLEDIKQETQVIFFLRDPVARFVSGFYSRKRKGRQKDNTKTNTKKQEEKKTKKKPMTTKNTRIVLNQIQC